MSEWVSVWVKKILFLLPSWKNKKEAEVKLTKPKTFAGFIPHADYIYCHVKTENTKALYLSPPPKCKVEGSTTSSALAYEGRVQM